MLTSIRLNEQAEQGGIPMTVTGEAFLPWEALAGRLRWAFICLEISSGVRGQTAPGGGKAVRHFL